MADSDEVRVAQEKTRRTFIRATAVIVIFFGFFAAIIVSAAVR